MQLHDAFYCQVHDCRLHKSLHPVLSCYLCTALDDLFCTLCCQPPPVRSLACARLLRTPAKKRAAGKMAWFAGRFLPGIPATGVRLKLGCRSNSEICWEVPAGDSCNGCPHKNGLQEQWRYLLEGSCRGLLQRMSAYKWAAGAMA